MVNDWQIHRRGDSLILGIAVERAVLDIVSDDELLKNCLTMLRSPHHGLVDMRMGSFGEFAVTLNLHHDDAVSIFIDGPEFDRRSVSIRCNLGRQGPIVQHPRARG